MIVGPAHRQPLATRLFASALALGAFAFGAPHADAQSSPTAPPTFRTSRDVVSVDVIVRDRNGAIVQGLTVADFEVREDGQTQDVLSASFQAIDTSVAPAVEARVLERLGEPSASRPPGTSSQADVTGRRMMLFLFDVSTMEPEDVDRAVRAAMAFVDQRMTSADMVAVATLSWELRVLTDFTGNRQDVTRVLQSLVATDVSTVPGPVDPTTDTAPNAIGGAVSVAATDARLRALRLLADALAPIAQKKALLYFTAGLGNGAQDTPAELRAATRAATRANLAIYPVDTRGLQAVIPNGPARTASRGGEGVFSGQDVNDQFAELTTSQDTMASMASATGGRLFSGANDIDPAFARVQQDTAAYYLLGYSSANDTQDGRFRRVQVRVKRPGLRIEARAGYYADRDFAHMTRSDREAQLEEQLVSPGEPTVDVDVSASWTHVAQGSFRVPFVTKSAWTTPGPSKTLDVDILAVVEDEQGQSIARLRDTVTIPAGTTGGSFIYPSGVDLPPGQFTIRSVVRENQNGGMGSAQVTLVVPDLTQQSLAVSPLERRETADGTTTLRVNVHDARNTEGPRSPLVVTLSLFKNAAPVMEAALLPVDGVRGLQTMSSFSASLPASAVPAGDYDYQVTVVDPLTGRFATVRAQLVLE